MEVTTMYVDDDEQCSLQINRPPSHWPQTVELVEGLLVTLYDGE
jgi:hypothetical protein